MTVVHNPSTFTSGTLARVGTHFSCDGVAVTVNLIRHTTVLSAVGELDASNLHYLVDCVDRLLPETKTLVVNLTGLGFLGAQGIQTLFEIDDACHRADVRWALLAGHPVERLLRICDQDGLLPTVPSIEYALQRFVMPEGRRLLQLVPQTS